MNDTERYKLIRNAIKRNQRKGVKIVYNNFGVHLRPDVRAGKWVGDQVLFNSVKRPQACALGCLMAGKKLPAGLAGLWDAASIMLRQRDDTFANGVTDGFDGDLCLKLMPSRYKAGFRIGQKLRQEFIKTKKKK